MACGWFMDDGGMRKGRVTIAGVLHKWRSGSRPVDFEPSHPKMGILVKEASEQASSILDRKR
jgi:hypothetical protein